MRILVAFAALASLATGAVSQTPSPTSGGFTAYNKFRTTYTVPGLWDTTGSSLLTSAVSINYVSYEMGYSTRRVWSGSNENAEFSAHHTDALGRKIWPLKIKLYFSSNQWVNYPNATIGIQICNYRYGGTTTSGSYSAPLDYFNTPGISNLVQWISPTNTYAYTLNYANVNPRTFTLGSFSIDPSDPAGTTGVATFDVVEGGSAPDVFPWYSAVGAPQTETFFKSSIPPSPTGYVEEFCGVIWLFPRVGQNGVISYQYYNAQTPYIEAPSGP